MSSIVEQATEAKEELAPSRSQCKNYSAGGHALLHVLSSGAFVKNSFAGLQNPVLHCREPRRKLKNSVLNFFAWLHRDLEGLEDFQSQSWARFCWAGARIQIFWSQSSQAFPPNLDGGLESISLESRHDQVIFFIGPSKTACME